MPENTGARTEPAGRGNGCDPGRGGSTTANFEPVEADDATPGRVHTTLGGGDDEEILA